MLSLSITWYWLWLILYEFFRYLEREKSVFLTNSIGQSCIFVMNRCEIRLSDKTHQKKHEKGFIYFFNENKIMNFISVLCL